MGRDPHSRFLHEEEYSTRDVSPALRDRKKLSGAAAGRAARFKALDAAIMRRRLNKKEAAEESMGGSRTGVESLAEQAERTGSQSVKKGVLIKGDAGTSQDEFEAMIAGKKAKRRAKVASIRAGY